MASIDEIEIADEPSRWSALGFELDSDALDLGGVRVRLTGARPGEGIVGWSLRDLGGMELDGLPTSASQRPPRAPAPPQPNGVVGIDHVVAFSPNLDRTVAALQAAGLDLRRVREEPTPAGAPRQAFFRLGREILEVVQIPGRVLAERGSAEGPPSLWGLALLVDDVDAAAAAIPGAGEPRAAVQPGRRIATLGRDAGLAIPLALISREQDAAPA